MHSPLFSVVIPLYNKENYIHRSVMSVLGQDFRDFELIVVDDGSNDASIAKLSQICDDRLSVVRQANQGVGAARNRNISESQASWIAFLDADDEWCSNHLQELLKIIVKYPYAGLISTQIAELDDSMRSVKIMKAYRGSGIRQIDYFHCASVSTSVVHSSFAAIARRVFAECGGFSDAPLGEDLEFWARIALSYSIVISSNITSRYFRNTGGVMEQAERSLCRAKPRIPDCLQDLSPSVGMLCAKLDSLPYLQQNASIKRYIDSRLVATVFAYCWNLDILSARHVMDMSLGHISVQQKAANLFLMLPDSLVIGLVLSAKALRLASRRVFCLLRFRSGCL